MRAQGRLNEAENLHTQSVVPLIAALPAGSVSAVNVEERLAATMAAESNRVADAALLAELLAPMLGARAGITTPASPGGRTAAAPPLVPVLAQPSAPARPAASIADFLDEMLAQETPQASPRDAPKRRVS